MNVQKLLVLGIAYAMLGDNIPLIRERLQERKWRKELLRRRPMLKEFPLLYHIIFPKHPKVPL